MKDFQLALGACALFLCASILHEPVSASEQTPRDRVLVEFNRVSGGDWTVRWPNKSRSTLVISGMSRPVSGSPEIVAKNFIVSAREIFGVKDFYLKLVDRSIENNDIHLFYEQRVGKYKVFNSSIDVHMNEKNQIYLINSKYMPNLKGFGNVESANLTSFDAIAAVRRKLKVLKAYDKAGRPIPVRSIATSPPELGYQIVGGSGRLAYRLTASLFEFVVDANNGQILEFHPVALFENGITKVFDPNPVFTLNKGNLKNENDTDYVALKGAYIFKSLPEIQSYTLNDKKRYKLYGPYVRAFDVRARPDGCWNGYVEVRKPPPVRPDPNFTFGRSDDRFEFAMVYYHIDKNQRYVQSLGFQYMWNRPIYVDAHGITADNSFYCPSPVGRGYLVFGDGGVQDAEDADVIIHEYGHALQDAASHGKYRSTLEAQSMGEGFGDYWAFSAHDDTRWAPCFAEWDGEGGCLRRLDLNLVYGRYKSNDPHLLGQIWSQGLRDLHVVLGKEVADKLILGSHILIPADPNFSDGLEALILADRKFYRGANTEKICSVFADRGISGDSCGYWMVMKWNKIGTDVDLHLRPPQGASEAAWNYWGDVAFYNRTPDWGVSGNNADDPELYRDCISSCANEQITVKTLSPGTYRVMAHYYSDHGLGPTTVSISVMHGAKTLYTRALTLTNSSGSPSDGDVWFAYDIVVDQGNKQVEVHPVNKVMKAGAKSSWGIPRK